MYVQQFFVKGLAHSSYLLGGSNACAIVDPGRDVEPYLDAAAAMGMKITHILETHLHADFVSGHLDLAERTAAPVFAPKAAECGFDHIPVAEGDTIELDNLVLRVLETPGHTPEHVVYVVTDTARGDEPVGVFSGDTLFVGDVGRPDLFPDRAVELASMLYDSVHQKLMRLPEFCEVYPAHGAGSLCGRSLGAKRTSTIGYERLHNSAVQIRDRQAFIESLTSDMPPAPDHFGRLSAVNAAGPALMGSLPFPAPLEPHEFMEQSRSAGTAVLDVRSYEAFGGQHVPGSYHVDIMGNFSTFAGWVLPPGTDILLVGKETAQIRAAVQGLRRVGVDQTVGHLAEDMSDWVNAGLPAGHVTQLSADELYAMSTGHAPMAIVDARAPGEYAAFHIDGAINIPAPDLRSGFKQLQADMTTVLTCSTGRRSSLGTSLLLQHGFERVYNLAGGMTGYSAAGHAPECPMCSMPHGPHFLGREMDIQR